MKSTLEKLSTLERKLNIEIPVTEVQAAFENAYKEVQKHVAIKGFRKGKAPITTIKNLYSDRVKQDVIQDLIQKHYPKALDQHSLDPIGYPAIEFDAFDSQADFKFTAAFEVRPEIPLKKVEGLEVKKEKLGSSDKFVNETLESWREMLSETMPIDESRPAKKDDVVVIDFASDFELTGTGEKEILNHELKIGSGQMIPGFEEGIEGMNIGDIKDITAKFPENYHVPDLQNAEKIFKITLKGIKKKNLLPLDDEFAKKVGQGETLEQLKAKITEDFARREEYRIKDELKSRLLRVLAENNPVEIPKSLLNEQKAMLIQNFEQRFAQQGISPKEYEEYKQKWDADFESTAKFMIQSSFLIDEIAKKNDLFVNKEELDKAVDANMMQARYSGQKVDKNHESNMRRQLAYKITEDKVVEFLLKSAKIQEADASEFAAEREAMN